LHALTPFKWVNVQCLLEIVDCTTALVHAGRQMQRLNAAVTFVAREKVNFELLVLLLDAREVGRTNHLLGL
jgi:hypothetical protein